MYLDLTAPVETQEGKLILSPTWEETLRAKRIYLYDHWIELVEPK